ncbi:hypothetical protein [Flindersiella endophytica]
MTKRRQVIESFAPLGGRILGGLTLVVALLVIIDIIAQWRTLDGLTAGGIVVALSALVWIAMIRPAVVAYEEALVIRNLVRDVRIPWARVQSAEIRPILIVNTEQGAYKSVAVAVTRADRRAMWRSKEDAAKRRDAAAAGAPPTPAARVAEHQSKTAPAMHAVHRIDVMAKKYAETSQGDVSKTWAWPEIAVFGAGVLLALVGYILTR